MPKHDGVKKTGSHYTPPELALFLARLALRESSSKRSFSVLDPACGDGSLLLAVAEIAGRRRSRSIRFVGLDRNPVAANRAACALAEMGGVEFSVEVADFLERAVELMPVDPVVNDHLGDVYWAVGRIREAEFQWSRALSFIDPKDTDGEADPERIRRKMEVGLDQVLAEEGAAPLQVANDDG